jgi:YHS domain-containing protein
MAKDPVCGMDVDPHTAKFRAEHGGRTYYFCAAGCRAKFIADPAKYLSKDERPLEPVPEGTIYTCPMHPEVRQIGPGACPICGMALEPELITAGDHGPHPELVDMQRRFWVGLALTIPVLVLEMGGHLFGWHHYISPTLSNGLQLLLATPVVLWAGWPFFERGWQSLVTRNLNMFTLIAMGTGVAWAYSVIATLAPGIFPAAFRGQDGAVAVYFEAAAVITVLVLLGQVLELRARARDTHVDHGRRRSWRPGRRADQERGSAGAHGEGRHTGDRQDRHADRRQAEGRRRGSDRRLRRDFGSEARRQCRGGERAPAGSGDRRRCKGA